MPVETIKQSLHIRRKTNKIVFNNLDRLWALNMQAKNHQELLDGLHPWNGPIRLIFNNTLSYFMIGCGIFCCLILFTAPANPYLQWCFLLGLCIILWAWISIENDGPILNAIQALESTAISSKYQLKYFSMPPQFAFGAQSALLQARLKQLFPLFDLGSIGNDFPIYATAIWEDANGTQHSVLLFQYRYVSELTITDRDGDQIQIKKIEKFLWGAFIFDINFLEGIAVTTHNRSFDEPYTVPWQTSDIQSNKKLRFYGIDDLSLAKQLKPTMILKIDQFFAHRKGSLLFHPEHQILCYLGAVDLFQSTARHKDIQDISKLRGHLRTLKLPHLEQLQNDLTELLE